MPSQLLRLFPLPSLAITPSSPPPPISPQSQPQPGPSQDQPTARPPSPKIKTIQKSLKYQAPTSASEADEVDEEDSEFSSDISSNQPGSRYIRYRKISELPEHAKAFYEVVGKFYPLFWKC